MTAFVVLLLLCLLLAAVFVAGLYAAYYAIYSAWLFTLHAFTHFCSLLLWAVKPFRSIQPATAPPQPPTLS